MSVGRGAGGGFAVRKGDRVVGKPRLNIAVSISGQPALVLGEMSCLTGVIVNGVSISTPGVTVQSSVRP